MHLQAKKKKLKFVQLLRVHHLRILVTSWPPESRKQDINFALFLLYLNMLFCTSELSHSKDLLVGHCMGIIEKEVVLNIIK